MTSIAIFRTSPFSDFSSHKIQCLNGNNFETINPISILFWNLLTYFTQRFQKCKVPFYDRGTLILYINYTIHHFKVQKTHFLQITTAESL